MDGSPRTSGAPGTTHHHHTQSYVDAETKQLRDHQQSREELLSKVHGLKNELQDWRYKMDGQVKNYRGELSSLKETLANEVASLRKELEETSERLKKQILVGDNDRSPAGRLLRTMTTMTSVALDEALKRVRSHCDVIGAGVMTRSGELLRCVGDFSRERARRCVRLVSVGSHALLGDEDEDGNEEVEISRMRRGDHELVVTRSADVVVGVALRASAR